MREREGGDAGREKIERGRKGIWETGRRKIEEKEMRWDTSTDARIV